MESRGNRKERIGIVVSDKLEKSVVVKITRTTKHPVYKRVIKKSVKVMASDQKKEAKTGDRVRIQETRPLSKNTRWRLTEVLK
jgi:small subunit ribosomal protein S17